VAKHITRHHMHIINIEKTDFFHSCWAAN